MDIYSTYYMLAAVKELRPEHTFFKRRYFPTNTTMDVFGTAQGLADYQLSLIPIPEPTRILSPPYAVFCL